MQCDAVLITLLFSSLLCVVAKEELKLRKGYSIGTTMAAHDHITVSLSSLPLPFPVVVVTGMEGGNSGLVVIATLEPVRLGSLAAHLLVHRNAGAGVREG